MRVGNIQNNMSFGKVVKMHCSPQDASYVAELANKPFNFQDKELAKEAKRLFNDVNLFREDSKAKVFISNGDVFILSGIESSLAQKKLVSAEGFPQMPMLSHTEEEYEQKLQKLIERSELPYALCIAVGKDGKKHLSIYRQNNGVKSNEV